MKKRLLILLKVITGLGLLMFLFYKIPVQKSITVLINTDKTGFVLLFLVHTAAILLAVIKLFVLLRFKNPQVKFATVLKAHYIGIFFNNFMPTNIGGDVFKIAELKRHNFTLRDVTAGVFLQRISGFAALVFIALFYSLPGLNGFERFGVEWLQAPFIISSLIIALGLMFFYWNWYAKIKPFLKRHRQQRFWVRIYNIIESFFVYRNNPGVFCFAVFLSVIFYLLLGINLIMAANLSRGDILFSSAFAAMPLIYLLVLLPVSVGSLGVREGIITFCLIKLGMGAPQALSAALLLRIELYLQSAAGGLIYLSNK